MSLRALLYAYVLGGITFVPLVIFACICITVYTSVPVPDPDASKNAKPHPIERSDHDRPKGPSGPDSPIEPPSDANDLPRTRKGWLTVRRTFEDTASDGSYVTFVKSYLDARSKDPKRSRPKDMWYVVLKGKVMYLYEDEGMTECEVAVELGGHDVVIYPEGLLDGELFTRRNAICLKPRSRGSEKSMPSVSKETTGDKEQSDKMDGNQEDERGGESAGEEVVAVPWFIFVRSCVDMEDWYLALVHASDHPPGTPMLSPLKPVFLPSEMNTLVATLDEQPDVIPMRWFNALLGRVFYSFYRTQLLESVIIGRLMKKLSKVKRPAFLTDIAVTQFSVGDKAPTLSKPMLKELTKEGDASLEVGLSYKGEIRATVEATAVINLGARFKSYTVKIVLAVVLRELEGNLLVKVKRPPSNRIWYAFTKPPRVVINVEPIVSDRQITWSMILNTIETKIEEIIIDSVVLPNMDDISFSDSVEHQHRGGIWADAVRLDKPMGAPASEVIKSSAPPLDSEPLDEPGPSILVRTDSEQEPAPETPSLDSIPIIRAVTTSSDRPSTTARRRSWFPSATGTELVCEHTEEVKEEVVRGRRERSSEPNGSLTPSSDTPTIQPSDVSDDQNANSYLYPRSSSVHSRTGSRSSRAASISSSIGGDESSNYLSDTSVASKSPRHSLGTSTTSTFLSALKSKAGDKQALSNTAKEAIRKWGVWGLKKDVGGNPSADELPEVGPSDHRPRTESTYGRQSYADMRAAVIERREREQSEWLNGGSSPVPIPQGNGREKGRSPSVSGGRIASHSSGSTSPGLSHSLGDNVPNDPFKDHDFTEVAEENSTPSLIHTQPSQGRMMTIPGIHASHRGEVMSMGNIAPVPPSPESKPKSAAIQSMYRLWKSPILTGQQSQEAQSPTSTSPGGDDPHDRNHDVAPLSLTPEVVAPPSRPVPPPLPPRTISSVAVRHAVETTDESVVTSSMSAASQALKTIASRDETRRLSMEISIPGDGELTQPLGAQETISTAVPGNKPPLPPRKIPG